MRHGMTTGFERAIHEAADWAIRLRRDLHARPEVAFQEHATQRSVRDLLESWGVPHSSEGLGTGVIAELRGTGAGPHVDVALRAELDALPVPDETRTAYRSTVDGVSHSCGHDAHLAAALLAIKALDERRGDWAGRVLLLAQPAEEQPPGGAQTLLESGSIPDSTTVYGAHLASDLPFGRVEVTSGPVQSANDRFVVRVQGVGGHGAMPELSRDAVVATSAVVTALQTVVSRTIGALESAVVTVGVMRSGTVFNAIADSGLVEGTVRTYDPAVRSRVHAAIARIAESTPAAHGCTGTLEWLPGYPAAINDEPTATHALGVLRAALPDADVQPARLPRMESDDFAYYLQRHRGNFFFVGSSDGSAATSHPHHHPQFDLDERAIPLIARAYVALALATPSPVRP